MSMITGPTPNLTLERGIKHGYTITDQRYVIEQTKDVVVSTKVFRHLTTTSESLPTSGLLTVTVC